MPRCISRSKRMTLSISAPEASAMHVRRRERAFPFERGRACVLCTRILFASYRMMYP